MISEYSCLTIVKSLNKVISFTSQIHKTSLLKRNLWSVPRKHVFKSILNYSCRIGIFSLCETMPILQIKLKIYFLEKKMQPKSKQNKITKLSFERIGSALLALLLRGRWTMSEITCRTAMQTFSPENKGKSWHYLSQTFNAFLMSNCFEVDKLIY